MLSSGIRKLDEILGGGIDFGRSVLIETISGLGDILALNIVAEALRRNVDSFIVLGRKRVRDIREFLRSRGVDPSSLTIVTTTEKGERKINLDELFMISHTIKDLARRAKLGYIDILQILLILHDPRKIYALFLDIISAMKELEVSAVMTLDKRFVDERTLAMFEDLADIVIEFEEVIEKMNVRRGVRVKKNSIYPPTDFYPVRVCRDGILID